MKKKVVMVFIILTTLVFCSLLYIMLFYSDHSAFRIGLVGLGLGLVCAAVILIFLINRYLSIDNAIKGNDNPKS